MNKIIWKSEKRKIADLKPSEYNPRQATEKEAQDLTQSLERFNLADPIIINKNNQVIGGHFRLKILKEKYGNDGLMVDVRVPDRQLTEEEERELNLRLNKNLGQWDFDALANFDEELLKSVGFESEELDKIFQLNIDKDADEVPEIKEKVNIKLGDMFKLGEHRLLCGDATKKEDIERLMGGDRLKLCFTSPPYNMAGHLYENYEEFINLHIKAIQALKPFLRGFIFWNISYNRNSRQDFLEILYRVIKESGLKFLELIVWDKGHGLPITSREGLTRSYEDILLTGDLESIQQELELFCIATTQRQAFFNKRTQRGITNYWRIDTNKTQLKNHQACYPVALPEKGILLMTLRDEIVLDPFGGSGSTLIACERLNRKCRMMEIDPKYCQVIIDRWEQYTGKKAEKL